MPKHIYQVKDMTCQGCAGTIRSALDGNEHITKVQIDVDSKHIEIESSLEWNEGAKLIQDAGYTPENGNKKSFWEKLFG